MISIVIYGMDPKLANTSELKELTLQRIPTAVSSGGLHGLSRDQVCVFMPPDLLSEGLGEEIIVHINDVPEEKPGRTALGIKKGLAATVKRVLHDFAREHMPQCTFIQVSTRSIDREHEALDAWTAIASRA